MIIGFAILGFLFFFVRCFDPEVHKHFTGGPLWINIAAFVLTASLFTGIGSLIGLALSYIFGVFS